MIYLCHLKKNMDIDSVEFFNVISNSEQVDGPIDEHSPWTEYSGFFLILMLKRQIDLMLESGQDRGSNRAKQGF